MGHGSSSILEACIESGHRTRIATYLVLSGEGVHAKTTFLLGVGRSDGPLGPLVRVRVRARAGARGRGRGRARARARPRCAWCVGSLASSSSVLASAASSRSTLAARSATRRRTISACCTSSDACTIKVGGWG